MDRFFNTVNGEQAAARAAFESFDPYTGQPWALIPADGPNEVDAAVASALEAFRGWA